DHGAILDRRGFMSASHDENVLVAVASDLLALTLIAPPGEMGADVVVGSTQRFGVPMGYGGPHAAFLATRESFVRQAPGRIIGVSVDAHGNLAYRMALQTREQHIRREKATSNICTAQVLLANIAGMYAVYHGPDGLRAIAERVHGLTRDLAATVPNLLNAPFFDTIAVQVPDADQVFARGCKLGVNLRRIDATTVGIALDETTTPEIVEQVRALFAPNAAHDVVGIPEALRRTSEILTHPVFRTYHSESQMLRYLRKLADR